jgi:HEAT repeat protein
MSICGAINAENDLGIVRRAVAEALAKAQTEEAKKLLREVLKKCEAQIDVGQ